MRFEWEEIDDYNQRTKVIGGWLVKTFESIYFPNDHNPNFNVGMAFVPDPKHEWEITND